MSTASVPLSSLSAVYHPKPAPGKVRLRFAKRRLLVWLGSLALAAVIYFGITALWNWKHFTSSSGGRYFVHRVVDPVPVFTQGDPRWGMELLGPSMDTIGQAGCALTSAAMVMASYGVDTDPHRLNEFLNANNGYTPNGWLYWEKASDLADGRVQKAYEDLPSYALIDQNLLAGNPVIVRLKLRNGTMHFVVIVGKEGWDYLIQDPAREPDWGIYPLKDLTDHMEGLRFYHAVVPPAQTPSS